ncbi:MAG: hypothetical protein J6B67_02845, partial [Oscillospiraceae bacterium]|nr:hypothetical protein [Oscillospiraceae bacterium]
YRSVTLMSVISTEPKASGEIRSLRMEITDFSTSLCSARNDIKKTQQLHKPGLVDMTKNRLHRSLFFINPDVL